MLLRHWKSFVCVSYHDDYYVLDSWVSQIILRKANSYQSYSCWPNRYQEPYLVVPRSEEYLFNEELINYGQNKITYVETLRLNGFKFVIASRMFAYDLPHSPFVIDIYIFVSAETFK
ncbi:glycosyltransferase-like protein [Blastocystis sp. subtype 4]|uniref:glycosyltransferase-like protein n=1 Tax=Blastocystis sp. subtype 4 TaxID=944170 RepID=UPI0007120660|nr:glycosyltransferase-like protein [Blastocystis sp. subtype 4]KNB42772.1 glycosyltransferase-like protein [Blastocystis sp. subtype 4]|eukprot:XP_014526215.1 glycosyltransferase-like protein [Blastocystis sp. subtype 4]